MVALESLENTTTLSVEFSLQTIPNQALAFLRCRALRFGFHWTLVENTLRIALVYQSRDALHTLLNLVTEFYDEKHDCTFLDFLQSKSKLYKSLQNITKFTSGLFRDISSKENVNFVLFEFIVWLYNKLGSSSDFLDRKYSGSTLLGYAVAEGNIQMLGWLLEKGANVNSTHYHEYREFFIEELAAYVSDNPSVETPTQSLLRQFRQQHKEIPEISTSERRARDVRQRKADIIRQCFFVHKADLYIEQLAQHTVEIEQELHKLLKSFSLCLLDLPSATEKCHTLLTQFEAIVAREFDVENAFAYCNFAPQAKELAHVAQALLDREKELENNKSSEHVLRLLFMFLFYYNQAVDIPVIRTARNDVMQFLIICDKHPDLYSLGLEAASVCFDYAALSDTHYKIVFEWLVLKVSDLTTDNLPLNITDNGALSSTLKVMDAISRTPRGSIIIKSLKQNLLLQHFSVILSRPQDLGVIVKSDGETKRESTYQFFVAKILAILANFAREVSTANFLVARDIFTPTLELIVEYNTHPEIYQHGVILVNRLFVEEKSRQLSHQRVGWASLDPVLIQGGSHFLEKYLFQVQELMWHGLNHFCYETPRASISACFMVWRLLYYHCIPENEISAFIDRFASKFRSLWDSTDDLALKICVLQVLRQILAIGYMNTSQNLIHISIEHDFLSYSYKCIKQYGTANKPRLIQVAFEFLAAISLYDQICYQLTQDKDWVIAEHLMVCLKHPDLIRNQQVQYAGCYLIGRLVRGKQSKMFVDLLNEYGIVVHLFEHIFARCHEPSFRSACGTAAAVLLVLVEYISIHGTLMRYNGIHRLVELVKSVIASDESFVQYLLQTINACCMHSSIAKQTAVRLGVPKLVSIALIKNPQLQKDKALLHLMNSLTNLNK